MDKARYQINIDSYEGPMDLLLHLVAKDEVDIYDISIESLTTQYLAHLETLRELDIPLASEFLVMASQLLYIKSRALLPRDVSSVDEIEDSDPRWDLIRQLLEYKKFKEAADHLKNSQRAQTDMYGKAFSLVPTDTTPPKLKEVAPIALLQAFQTALKRFQETHEIGEITDDQFSVSDKIDQLLALLREKAELTFSAITAGVTSKQELIVTFLAILELTKLRQLNIHQDSPFGDLYLTPPHE